MTCRQCGGTYPNYDADSNDCGYCNECWRLHEPILLRTQLAAAEADCLKAIAERDELARTVDRLRAALEDCVDQITALCSRDDVPQSAFSTLAAIPAGHGARKYEGGEDGTV